MLLSSILLLPLLRMTWISIVSTIILSGTLHAQATTQLSQEDWNSVVQTYESQIGEGKITVAALNNLALARFKLGEYPQAVAVWVAAWSRSPHDQQIISGMLEAQKSLGIMDDTLNLQAHGPWQGWVAERGEGGYLEVLRVAVFTLIFTCIVVLFYFFSSFLQKFLTDFWSKVLLYTSVALSAVVWTFLWVYVSSLGTWGAVVDENQVVIRSGPSEEAQQLGQIKSGTPVYILGDTYAMWLYVKTYDGLAGYVNALSVRVIR